MDVIDKGQTKTLHSTPAICSCDMKKCFLPSSGAKKFSIQSFAMRTYSSLPQQHVCCRLSCSQQSHQDLH